MNSVSYVCSCTCVCEREAMKRAELFCLFDCVIVIVVEATRRDDEATRRDDVRFSHRNASFLAPQRTATRAARPAGHPATTRDDDDNTPSAPCSISTNLSNRNSSAVFREKALAKKIA